MEEFECLGLCETDPVSGFCTGCGRPMNLTALMAYNARRPPAPSAELPAADAETTPCS